MKLAMTIEEALAFADEWSKGVTLYEGAQGWRVVCMLLAEEVRRRHGIGGELIALRRDRDSLLGQRQDQAVEIDRLRNALEMLEIQAVPDITTGWISIPAVEWDAIMADHGKASRDNHPD